MVSSPTINVTKENVDLVLEKFERVEVFTVLAKSGSSFDRVAFVRVYLVNFQDFDKVNNIYKTYFNESKLPARTCIGVSGLAVGASVEIDLVAKL